MAVTYYTGADEHKEWRPILGVAGCEISNSGRVRTRRPINGRGPLKDSWRPMNPFLVGGYLKFSLPGRGHVGLSVLLLETFVGPRQPKMVARHLNDVPLDNRLENLAWGTQWENKQDAIRNGRTGRGQKRGPRSAETRLKLSIAHMGKTLSAEHRRKIGEGGRGKKRSEESRRKMSMAQMGNKKFLGHKHSEETRRKISNANTGRVFSDLHRARLAAAGACKEISKETRAKMIIGLRAAWVGATERRAAQSALMKKLNEKRRTAKG